MSTILRMFRQLRLQAYSATLFLLVPSLALAYSIGVPQAGSHYPLKWNKTSVTYYVNPLGAPGMTPTVTSQQLQLGFQGWMDVPCGNLKFVLGQQCNTSSGTCLYDKGVSCSQESDCPSAKNLKLTPLGTSNGRNELGFVNTSAWTFGAYVLGVTSPSFNPQNGYIAEADIVFNGYYYNWAAAFADAGPWDVNPTPSNKTKMHLLSVAIHEEGHFFGAQHNLKGYSQSDPPTMAPEVDPYGNSATLNADDQKIICFLYPKSAPYTCAVDTDCPYVNETDSSGQEYYSAKLGCDATTKQCSWTASSGGGTTTGKLGDTCNLDADCTSPLFCQPVDTTSYCSKTCTVNSSTCGTGFTCVGYTNGNGQGACVPNSGGTTGPTQNAGDSCSANSDCVTGLCLSAICRVQCTTANPTQCGSGEVCQGTGKTGVGACVPGTLKSVGSTCADASECQSDTCINGFCRATCVNKSDCPTGQGCLAQPDGTSACIPGTGGKLPAGSLCTSTTDCATGTCVKVNASDAQAACRNPCVNGGCAAGESCQDVATGAQACIPDAAVKKAVGDTCATSDACDSNLCVAGPGGQTCTQVCTVGDSTTCPCGMECVNTTAGGLCFAGKKVHCVGSGGYCTDTSECAGGTCTGNICVGGKAPDSGGGTTQAGGICTVTAIPGTCATDLNCQRSTPTSTSGICAAVGPKGEYEPCTADAQCHSLFCAADVSAGGATRCVRPCDPQNNLCGDGQGCYEIGGGLGACYVLAAIAAPGTGGAGAIGGDTSGASSGCTAAPNATDWTAVACALAGVVLMIGRKRERV